jgi:hypothetical protein
MARDTETCSQFLRLAGELDADGSGEHPRWEMLRDTFGAVYKVEGYDGNEVRYGIYDLTHPGELMELQHSQSWAGFLADLESEIECP